VPLHLYAELLLGVPVNLRIAYNRSGPVILVNVSVQRDHDLASPAEPRGQFSLEPGEWEMLAERLGIEPVNAEGNSGVLILRRPEKTQDTRREEHTDVDDLERLLGKVTRLEKAASKAFDSFMNEGMDDSAHPAGAKAEAFGQVVEVIKTMQKRRLDRESG
jgi:hypothetical protein